MVRFQIPTRATLKIEGFTLKAHIMYNKKKTHLLVLTYSGDLNTLLVGYLNGQREVGCQMVQFFNYRKDTEHLCNGKVGQLPLARLKIVVPV